jgi:PAS domain S-box-containing protein
LDALVDEVRTKEEELCRQGRELEEALREVRAHRLRYQELFDFAPDGYLVTDARGVIEEANHAAAALLGMRKEFLIGKPFAFFVAERDQRAFFGRLGGLTHETGGLGSWELGLRPPRADPLDVSLTVSAFNDVDGRPAGFRWLLRDISARSRAERALRAEKQFADSLVQAAPALILVLDAEGRIARSNPYLYDVAGYGPEELEGRDWSTLLFAEADRPEVRAMHREALARGTGPSGVHVLVARDGRRRVVAWSARSLAADTPPPPPPEPGGGQGGVAVAVLLVGHDITELQQAQRQALQAERLAAIGHMVTALAHESRNALQRGQACLERLGWRLHDQPEALDLVARARQAQDDLLRLYEDVRYYAAPIRPDYGRCNLAEVWQRVWGELQSAGPPRDAHLEQDCGGVDLGCQADPFRLGQVFRNILENALAACRDPVRVTVSYRETEWAGRPALRMAVRDNGPGLGAEQRQRMFEPFYTTKVKGTGLGMAIAKRIMEAHGGQIALGTGPPGAEILLTLPREPL